MIAALPMYDPPHLQGANDRLWAGIRDALRAGGRAAPEALSRGEDDLWRLWTAPDLVLAQTCGFPYRARLHGQVTLVGTPDHGVPGCPPGHYCSVLVARADDPRPSLADFDGAALAWNEALSQSGWAAPQAEAARLGITLRAGPQTGAHRASIRAVAEGRADIAAIDAVTWDILAGVEPARDALRIVARSAPTPGLPLIAAAGADSAATLSAVAEGIARLAPADRAALRLRGVVVLPAAAYLAVPTPAPPDRIVQST
ncbi:MAG TPA: PhnD/SsuA/transferrin family substrate-binding protein [Paracoccaceae bacterium]|nr:PhnD/SsuA/transferrin family substrate-binding protein [Paracoccaceae bacterium]